MVIGADEMVSKKAQVLRESSRRKRVCSGVSIALRRASGRLIHHAMAGDANHRNRIGPATASAAGFAAAR